jgi:hypothetical protein
MDAQEFHSCAVYCLMQMLQHGRFPQGPQEWAQLGEAVSSLGPYLQSTSTPETLLRDLQLFVIDVERWWASRRRSEGGNGMKRVASQALVHENSKRMSADELFGGTGLAQTLPLMAMPTSEQLLQFGMPLDGLGHASLAAQPQFMHGVATSASLGLNQLPRQITAGMDGDVPRSVPHTGGALPLDFPKLKNAAQASTAMHKVIVTLNVGGKMFQTTLATMAAVPGSYFAKLASKSAGNTEFFVERNGDVFRYILDHLRAQRYDEEDDEYLPDKAEDLKLVKREASFYRLPGLVAAVERKLNHAPGPRHRFMDIYEETGWIGAEDDVALARQEALAKLNAEVASREADGFKVVQSHINCHNYDDRINIRYHILLHLHYTSVS